MPYVAEPRGGATRNYIEVPKTAIEEPENFDPVYGYENDKDANQYKSISDTVLFATVFFIVLKFISKLKKQQ